jgi:hypothetical protein
MRADAGHPTSQLCRVWRSRPCSWMEHFGDALRASLQQKLSAFEPEFAGVTAVKPSFAAMAASILP